MQTFVGEKQLTSAEHSAGSCTFRAGLNKNMTPLVDGKGDVPVIL